MWQPIETVDKTKEILLYYYIEDIVIGKYCDEYTKLQTRIYGTKNLGFKFMSYSSGGYGGEPDQSDKFTHWMPLPNPPVNDKEN